MTTRRHFLLGAGAATALAACGRKPAPRSEFLAKAKALIAARPSLDLHAHPGQTFIRDAANLSPALMAFAATAKGNEERVIEDMRAGGMTAAVFAAVADFQILGLGKGGLHARREFKTGEAFASYKKQIANLKKLVSKGLVSEILTPSDLEKVKAAGGVGAVLASEGADFLEGSAERVAEAYQDGVRCITPVHYHTNELGDIMTEAPTHDGITDAGKTVIKAMNRAGIIVDVAHASEATAFGMLEASDKPVLCSHTHIKSAKADSPRFISLDLAKAISQSGGVIGAWPAGIGIKTLDEFIDRLFELVDAVGADHVGIGTDMDANYKPVWDNYRQFPDIVAGLIERGMADDEIAKIIGGNGLRVFSATTSN